MGKMLNKPIEDIREKTFSSMTQEELESLVIYELKRIDEMGYSPTTANYSKYKTETAPQYPTLRGLMKADWKTVVKKAGLSPTMKTIVRRDWQYVTDEEFKKIVFDEMQKLDNVTYAEYQANASDAAPSIPTVLSRFDMSWSDLLNAYYEERGAENVKTSRLIRIPYDRYRELSNIEMAYEAMMDKVQEVAKLGVNIEDMLPKPEDFNAIPKIPRTGSKKKKSEGK